MLRLDVSGIRMASWSIRMCSLVDYQLKKEAYALLFLICRENEYIHLLLRDLQILK